VAGFAYSVFHVLDSKQDAKPLAEVSSNYMGKLDKEMIFLFRKAQGGFYKVCPKEKQEIYKKHLLQAIKHVESIMIIETSLIHRDRTPSIKDCEACNLHYEFCVKSLLKCYELFEKPFHKKSFFNLKNYLQNCLIDHVVNVRLEREIY
jgi:hypothetical protein